MLVFQFSTYSIVLNKVIRPMETPIADINDPIVILPLVTKKQIYIKNFKKIYTFIYKRLTSL